MRRLTVTGLIALAILVGFARPASAQWNFLKWLEELSGPGPFHMNGLDVVFYCPSAHARAALNDGHKDFRLFCDKEVGPFENVKFYAGFSFLKGSGHNPLTYAVADPNRRVSAQSYAAIVGYRLSQVTDVGTQIGVAHFSAEDTGSDKVFFDPYIALRPLAALRNSSPTKDRLRSLVELRFGVLLFPQGFTLDDFGAIGGPLTGKAEAVWHLGVLIDVTSFLPFNR